MSIMPFDIADQKWPDRKKKDKVPEWKESKKWNPFSAEKLFAHVYRWRLIERGKRVPAPVMISVDPTNLCDFDCIWCNAKFVRTHRNRSLSKKVLLELADFLPRWGEGNPDWKTGVEAVCIAGGGEPLLNPHTGEFIERATANGVVAGLITNGVHIYKYIPSISKCTWVSVSMDAGTPHTHHELKRYELKRINGEYTFSKIIDNISNLVNYARSHNERLGDPCPAYGVTYKYLLHPGNIGEVYQSARLAKEIGCKNICFRPAGTTWDELGTENEIKFSPQDLEIYKEQISEAIDVLDDDSFNVYAYTYRFGAMFKINNCFKKCFAIFMNAVFQPPASKDSPEDSFTLSLCCDRRGDDRLELLQDSVDIKEIDRAWGSERHWEIHDEIDHPRHCPRCIYNMHNRIYEQVILNDILTYKLI